MTSCKLGSVMPNVGLPGKLTYVNVATKGQLMETCKVGTDVMARTSV